MTPAPEPPRRFLGSGPSPERASLVLFGVPLDLTASFRPGTDQGPRAIRECSQCLEEYSVPLGRDLRDKAYWDMGDLVLPPDPEAALPVIEQAAEGILARGQRFIALGGEHLLTLPLVRALARHHPDLVILHFDAHADMREDYEGVRLSHATVLRRVVEVVGPGRLFQFGIRSGIPEELAFARAHGQLFLGDTLQAVRQVVPTLAGRPAYLTIDVDVVDPAFAPGVGVPEPAGLTSHEILACLELLSPLHIVSMDLVEVCPPFDPTQMTAVLAARLVREAILTLF